MNLEQIKNALKDRRIGMVAKETGLHANTIRDIRDGRNNDPKISTINALIDYLEGSTSDDDQPLR